MPYSQSFSSDVRLTVDLSAKIKEWNESKGIVLPEPMAPRKSFGHKSFGKKGDSLQAHLQSISDRAEIDRLINALGSDKIMSLLKNAVAEAFPAMAKDYPGKNVKRRKDGVPAKNRKKRECKKGEHRDKNGDIQKNKADEKAGYPPNCNDGYKEKDGKCVPVEEGKKGKEDKNKLRPGDTKSYTNCPTCY